MTPKADPDIDYPKLNTLKIISRVGEEVGLTAATLTVPTNFALKATAMENQTMKRQEDVTGKNC